MGPPASRPRPSDGRPPGKKTQPGLFPGLDPTPLGDAPAVGPFAEVAPEVPVRRAFTYRIPPELVDQVLMGVRVRVPFGGRTVDGFVTGVVDTCDVPARKVKAILDVIDPEPVVDPAVLEVARWAASYYHASVGDVLAAAIPKEVARRPEPPRWVLLTGQEPTGRLGVKQKRTLEHLAAGEAVPLDDLRKAAQVDGQVIRRLEERGLVRIEKRLPPETPAVNPTPLELTFEQAAALKSIMRELDMDEPKPILLFGVTGSGKTEVYLQAIASILEQGKGAIVLVPEIALTPQTLERFRARFGSCVAVLHSQLSGRDRRHEWWRVRHGHARVVVGPRSAVWAPVRDLGLIVVDEEHENTYKQSTAPRYHARDLAVVRAKLAGIPVVLGSATPALESYANASRGRYRMARMTSRPGGSTLPNVTIVDMAQEYADVKAAPLLSRVLMREMKAALERDERVLLFQNRRGFTTYLQCTACGYVAKCESCDVTLTYHRSLGALVCHFCDDRRGPPTGRCPDCLGPPMKQRGAGTERIEEVVQTLFPQAAVGRLDTDVVRGGDSPEQVIDRFRSGELNVLVGTQMIAKGLDIAAVTVVGVISADTSLSLPDFRAAERTFQLVAQVAGRAGRGKRSGCTVVQTFVPEHFALQAAAQHRFEDFASVELKQRAGLGYPPHGRLLKVLFRGPDEQRVQREAERVIAAVRGAAGDHLSAVLGPAPSPRAYLSNKYRWQVLIKAGTKGVRHAIAAFDANRPTHGVECHLDVDPFDLL
ncbi:primosomal protein N' [Planctomycetota bacterium]|nr:primosomal protein N' [Planctomycetota bacterium]